MKTFESEKRNDLVVVVAGANPMIKLIVWRNTMSATFGRTTITIKGKLCTGDIDILNCNNS